MEAWSLELCHDFCPYRIFCYRTNLKDLGCWLLDLTLIIRWHRILKLKDWGQRLKIKYEAVSSVQFIWVTQITNLARFPFLYRFQLSQILYRILKKIQIPCTLIILLHFTFFYLSSILGYEQSMSALRWLYFFLKRIKMIICYCFVPKMVLCMSGLKRVV